MRTSAISRWNSTVLQRWFFFIVFIFKIEIVDVCCCLLPQNNEFVEVTRENSRPKLYCIFLKVKSMPTEFLG